MPRRLPPAEPLTPRRQQLAAAYLARYPDPAATVRRIFPGLWHLCQSIGVNADDVRGAAGMGVTIAAARWRPGQLNFRSYCLTWMRSMVVEEARKSQKLRAARHGIRLELIGHDCQGRDDPAPDEVSVKLGGLTAASRTVLELRFGLAGEGPLLLREIASRMGVTRERVRQIEAKALAFLRARIAATPGEV